ncbi:leucine aminopeptidase [Lentinula raphanica]|nr:leucine aminopeptidase [Lentinula raphanica]
MSTSAFVVPVDPKTPSSPIPNVDLAKIWATVPQGDKVDVGKTRVFYDTPATKITAASSLGSNFANQKGDVKRESVRKSVGSAVKTLKALDGLKEVIVDASADPHASAVAANLALYNFSLKTTPPSPFNPNLKEPIPPKLEIKAIESSEEWDQGVVYAYSQNLARTLMELPANMMTPTASFFQAFCERAKAEFAGVPNVEIYIRDEAWAASKGMNTFLSVTHGTNEPAKFLEIHYKGAPQKDAQPLAFVGKGITFDSGGISLKPGQGMKLMRGDMGGAATVVSATLAIAKLKLPINLVTVTPLTENLPGPSATKPGDIIYAMNGKSVEVDNTDAEGRLVLSDAIYYASTEYKPHTLIDVATLTGAMMIALGEIFTGVFSTSDELWERLHAAGEREFDRFWRMPLSEDFGPQIYSSNADLCNTGGRPGGSCTAALFLKAFAHGIEAEDGSNAETAMKWAHLDIAGTMEATRPTPYQEKGMTGRPVRSVYLVSSYSIRDVFTDVLSLNSALIEYVRGLAN